MRILATILCMSFVFSGELEVEGDLKVTGTIENDLLQQEIAQLHATIEALQAQINYLSSQLGYTDCNGVIGGGVEIDCAGVCGGNSMLDCNGDCIENFDGGCLVYDIDGNEYHGILIGEQFWLQENLKVSRYNDGSLIPSPTGSSWADTGLGAYSIYDNNEANSEEYGYLYNWYAGTDNRGICPEGWSVPSEEDWIVLETYLGIPESELNNFGLRGTDEALKLKEVGTSHWDENNLGTNETGFTARGSGYYSYNGQSYENLFESVHYWTRSQYQTSGYNRSLESDEGRILRTNSNKHWGFSIRCVRD